jgi:hypothetical protein
MSLGLIVCRSTDSGAPVLSGTNGALCLVLDWALAQKSWTTSYTSTNARVYKQPAGNGFSLSVTHDSAVSGVATKATIRGCEAATSVTALTNPFPTVAQVANTTQTFTLSNAASSAARPYVIYLTDRYVRMEVDVNGTNAIWQTWHFGDLVSTVSGDSYLTHMSNISYGNYEAGNQASGYGYFVRDITGTILSSRSACTQTPGVAMGPIGGAPGQPAARAGYMNRIVRFKMAVNCLGSTTTVAGPTALPARGWIPNIWMPAHAGMGALSMSDTFSDSAYNPAASFSVKGTASIQWHINEETDTWSAPSG